MTDEMVLTYSLRMTNPQSHDMEMTGSAVLSPIKPLEETELVPPASRPKPPGPVAYNSRALVLHNLVIPAPRTEMVRWSYEMTMPNVGSHQVVCLSGRDEMVPHGLDEDILKGAINAYVANGSPADGTIQMTVAQFLAHAGMKRDGNSRKVLTAGLQRLQSATYRVNQFVYDQRREKHRWTQEQFSLIDSFRFYDEISLFEYIGQNTLGTILKIRLSATLMNSLRGGHVLTLQRSRLNQMSRHTRILYGMLYELLQCHREINGYDVNDVQISFKLPDWADYLHLTHGSKNIYQQNRQIKTTLESTSKELLEKGVIRNWEVSTPAGTLTGRASFSPETRLNYTVRGDMDANMMASLPDELVAQLHMFKLSTTKLEHISTTYSAEYIQQCLDIYQSLSAVIPVDRPAGLLLKILKNPSDFDGWRKDPQPKESKPRKGAAAQPPLLPPESELEFTLEMARSALSVSRKDKSKESEEYFEKVAQLFVDKKITILEAVELVKLSKSELEAALSIYSSS